jgi:hypothetical protein
VREEDGKENEMSPHRKGKGISSSQAPFYLGIWQW